MKKTWYCLRSFALLLLLTIVISGSAAPQPEAGDASGHSGRAYGERRRVTGIGDFGEVTPRLFRGAQPNHAGFKALSRMGVGIVVDTRGNRTRTEGKEVRRLGMRYVAIPWHCPFPHDETFAKFLRLMRENPDKKVFVHCRLGDDRTGMMIAAYRMADEHWTADEAMREMREFGFNEAHHVICPTLASYEEHFPEHLKTNPVFRGER
ncbi:MAG TPA: dual specificity protein phosphatase family protein [Terriglobales bacterium]|jgi:tyrosine-protein phosphatase SIW14|nr:dual specificity protein phosphatase family protein [Terriglobales bacterium]